MVESGECSGAKLSNEVCAMLVPSESRYLDVEIRSDEEVICSDIISSSDKHNWCRIIRNSDLCSATLENKGHWIQKDASSKDGLHEQSVLADTFSALSVFLKLVGFVAIKTLSISNGKHVED